MSDRHTLTDDDALCAPGTVRLEDWHQDYPASATLVRSQRSPWRKATNVLLASFYVLLTFAQLDIPFTAWSQYEQQLGFSPGVLNSGAAFNHTGLAIGCFFLVPLVHKYGWRPLYLVSILI
ncbi:Major facilitator superfamily domain, general substrate transporter [Cordyceps fumosorosea ARSEF 2679]|uniref:Major facilitator superfamily domain, general substrate transporter n=1 Tax=Cordyceps fumosorosea (strain ARSEF 2679) TaxID=1081104 RepID=A0A162LJU9_CORFA|nr:Major facilitator superfamily domain, general substrate transporter [Cordyceps fumosorosea ARSEF 2679]OAA71584.1 Major facilitator superfamily domain, general substrate transporter [Cordyceps fumosorosea ARSEF 2679]